MVTANQQDAAAKREATRNAGMLKTNQDYEARIRIPTSSKTKTITNKEGRHYERVSVETKVVNLPIMTIMGQPEDNPFQAEVKRLTNRSPQEVMDEARNPPKDPTKKKRVMVMQMRGNATWVNMTAEQEKEHNAKLARMGEGIFLVEMGGLYAATRGKFGGASIKTVLFGMGVKGAIGSTVNTTAQIIKNDGDISLTNMTQVGIGFVQGALAPDAGLRWQLAKSFIATEALNIGTGYIGSRIDGSKDIGGDMQNTGVATSASWAVGALFENVFHIKGAIGIVTASQAAKKAAPKALVLTKGTKVVLRLPFADDVARAGQNSAAAAAKKKAAQQAAQLQKQWGEQSASTGAWVGNSTQEAVGASLEDKKEEK